MQGFGQPKLSQRLSSGTLILVTAALLSAADFPQWRGPNRDGLITGVDVKAWPEKLRQRWSARVGEGHSSPIVVGTRAFQHARVGDREVITAFDLGTGKKLWEHGYSAPYEMNSAATAHGKGPKSTPVAANGKLYTFGIEGALYCTDLASGAVVWKVETHNSPDFGTALSPAVDGGIVYAHLGGASAGALTAIDAVTGKTKWEWKGDSPAYSSPVIAMIGGTRQLVTQTKNHLIALDAATGQELWKLPFATMYDQNSVTPVVHDGLVIYSGIGKPVVAVRPQKTAKGWAANQVWENKEVSLYMNTPVLSSGLLWGLNQRNKGQFFGMDPKSGKTVWTSPGRQAENAAMLSQGDLVFALTTESELVVFRSSPAKLEELKRYTVANSPTWAHPAISGRSILIKDKETLSLWSVD